MNIEYITMYIYYAASKSPYSVLATPIAVLHNFINISFIKLFEEATIKMNFILLCMFRKLHTVCCLICTVFAEIIGYENVERKKNNVAVVNFPILAFHSLLDLWFESFKLNDRPKTIQWEHF